MSRGRLKKGHSKPDRNEGKKDFKKKANVAEPASSTEDHDSYGEEGHEAIPDKNFNTSVRLAVSYME